MSILSIRNQRVSRDYASMRRRVGSQTWVAERLGIARDTLVSREEAEVKITMESWLAMELLAQRADESRQLCAQDGDDLEI